MRQDPSDSSRHNQSSNDDDSVVRSPDEWPATTSDRHPGAFGTANEMTDTSDNDDELGGVEYYLVGELLRLRQSMMNQVDRNLLQIATLL